MAKRAKNLTSRKKPTPKRVPRRSDIRFRWSSPKLSTRFLSATELYLAPIRLPDEFRRFLLKHNGGAPSLRVFHWEHPENGDHEAHVDDLLGIDPRPLDDRSRRADCVSVTLGRRDVLPRYCIPIGFADRDDVLLLFTSGSREGQVWIKYGEEAKPMPGESDLPPAEEALYFVADSFNAFLALLADEEDPYHPIYFALDGRSVRGKQLEAKLEALGCKRFKYPGVMRSQRALPPMWEWPKYRRSDGEGPATVSVEKNFTYGHAAKIGGRKKGHPILAVNASGDDRKACLKELEAALGKEAVRG